jgi:non-heme chloroperoxidase
MMCGFTGAYDCIKAFLKTDFTKDPKKMDGAVLMLHGDDGPVIPSVPALKSQASQYQMAG